MGADTQEENRKLLDYQLSDFLELKLGNQEWKLTSKLKHEFLNASTFRDSNLYEIPTVGTSNACLILSNGLTGKLKQIFLLDSDGRLKKIPVR